MAKAWKTLFLGKCFFCGSAWLFPTQIWSPYFLKNLWKFSVKVIKKIKFFVLSLRRRIIFPGQVHNLLTENSSSTMIFQNPTLRGEIRVMTIFELYKVCCVLRPRWVLIYSEQAHSTQMILGMIMGNRLLNGNNNICERGFRNSNYLNLIVFTLSIRK